MAGETKTIVGMMYRAERTRTKLKVIATVVILTTLALITTSALTNIDQFNDPLFMVPFLAFASGFLLGSFQHLDQAEMREHRAWEKKARD